MTDVHLLQQFVQAGDQEAFRQIVERHIDMVYTAAIRQISDPAAAEDVTQAVFIVLARKARKLNGATLAGWLVNAARLIAMDTRRQELRRKVREQKAAAMKPESYTPEAQPINAILDAALSRLRETDQAVVTLRYLQGMNIPEVAVTVGMSEAAVAKRLARSLAKLRDIFARKGVQLPFDGVATAIISVTRLTAPYGLAGRAVGAALGKAAVATTASAMAHAMIGSMTTAAVTGWTAAAAAVAISASFMGYEASFRYQPPLPPAPVVYTAPVVRPIPPAKVGIVVSQFTATGPNFQNVPYGYKAHLDLLRALRDDPALEMIPVVEPGSLKVKEVEDIVRTSFRGGTPVDASDTAALMGLDVIVCPRVWDESAAVLDSIESAVRQGKGLLNGAGIGLLSPGPDAQISRFNGVADGVYAGYPLPVECEVMADHPLLGTLAKGDSVYIAANGEGGPLAPGTVGLIEVRNPRSVQLVPLNVAMAMVMQNSTAIVTKQGQPARVAVSPTTTGFMPMVDAPTPRMPLYIPVPKLPEDYAFYPLSITPLGKGTILNCQIPVWQVAPPDLQNATNQKFFVRCVRWLAGRPLD